MSKNIDLNSIRAHSGNIAIVGHGTADFDAMVSGILLERVFRRLNIEAYFCVPDGYHDEFFVAKAREMGFDYVADSSLVDENAVLFLVDHTADYPNNQVIGCFDHHPQLAEISCNYVNQPQTCCAKIIYDWAVGLGVKIPQDLTEMVVYACHMDSLSFKSSKALPEDREWCREMMAKYDMDEDEVILFGYGVTDTNLDAETFFNTGLKTYALGDKNIKASYAVTAGSIDEDLLLIASASEYLRQKLDDKTVAWCYLTQNAALDWTHVVLIQADGFVQGAVDRVLSRGKDVIPAVMEYLSK